MKTIEKVVRESIDRINKRLAEIKKIMDYNPIGELISVRKEFQELLEANQGWEKRTTSSFTAKVESLHKREKKAIDDSKNQVKVTTKLIDEQIDLESELFDLKNELFRLTR